MPNAAQSLIDRLLEAHPNGAFDAISESRPVHTSALTSAIGKLPGYQVVDSWYTADGSVVLVRAKDGQAYEVEVVPADQSKFEPFQRNYGTGAGRKRQAAARQKANAAPAK